MSKQGADDYLVANDPESFRRLIEEIKQNASSVLAGSQLRSDPTAENANRIIKIIPPVLEEPAYFGMVGDFLRAVSSHTEATEAGMLAHFLPAVGTLIGTGPHVFAGAKQSARINTAVVGPTSSGRKGTAAVPTDLLMQQVACDFWSQQRVSGLSSGEGLIAKVADIRERTRDGWEITETEKRLYVIEPEFSRVLANIRREGNVLSQVMREGYDSGNLSTLTVNPRVANGAHISIVVHITREELDERLSHIEMANGFGNRFLWFYSESEKLIPHTKPFPTCLFLPFEKRLRTLLIKGATSKSFAVPFDRSAAKRWEDEYPKLREDRPGLAGAMIGRRAPMVQRMALLYCLLDRWGTTEWNSKSCISIDHLEAALAVWRYAEESAMQLFGSKNTDALAAKLLRLLKDGPLTRSDFNTHLSPKQKTAVDATLARMEKAYQIRQSVVVRKGPGRPAVKWELVKSE